MVGNDIVDLADPGCLNAGDASELGPWQCDDGIDNDNDGKIDSADPHCSGPTDNREAKPKKRCGLGFEIALLLMPLAALRASRRRRRGDRR